MEPQININSSLDIEHIYNAFSNVNYPADNESIQFSNLINNEDQNLNLDNYCLNNNQNLIEEANDNMEENAAPHISNNLDNLNIDNVLEDSQVQDFSNFSILNSLNFCDINKDAKDFDDNNNINFNEQIDLEKKENDCEKKELHFQMGDFVTPSGDNDNIDNSNNNLNSKSTNSGNNKIETPGNNLSNSSSSQNTNKSSVLSISLSNNTPLNNSSNEKLEVICKTFYPGTKTEEEEIKENEKELNPTPKKKKTKKPKTKKKYKLEGIRKKIKSRLHKKLKCYFNKKLTECGSKMLFDCFPQSFITDVSVIKNKAYLNLSMRKLLTMIFGTRAKDKEKINVNKKVLYYLDDNPEIRIKSGVDKLIKSGVDKFLNSLYRDIINEYMEGKLFEEDLNKLKKEGKPEEYIGKYKYLGEHLVEFFENGRIPKTPDS